MLITSAYKNLKPRPIKPSMSLLFKAAEMTDKAVGDVGEADEVDLMPTQRELYPRKKLTR
jgi:hypothetical protein